MIFPEITKREAATLAIMIDSDLIGCADYIRWADNIILNCSNPPHWIIELSLSNNKESAVLLINKYALSAPFQSFNLADLVDQFVASQWLRHAKNYSTWRDFLLTCGDYTDANDASVDCSYFYCMLSEYEESNYAENIYVKQNANAYNLFHDVIQQVQKEYSKYITT